MKTKENIYRAILVLAVAMILLPGFMLLPSGADKLLGWLVFLWTCAPFLMLMVVAKKVKSSISAIIVLFISELLISCAGLFIIWQAFITHPDAQNGLIFIFMPGYQLIAPAVGSIIAGVLRP